MATEAALLGTPTVRSNTFVGERDMGNFVELEQRYGLLFNYREPHKATEKAVELVHQPDVKAQWQAKRERLLSEKIDIAAFMLWFIEQYPESCREFADNPDVQYRFK
jgi:predicted glycosyltransferase